MIVCKEMQKLRDWLDENGIEWIDDSLDMPNIKLMNFWICRTHFELCGYEWSVINGCGTWGGFRTYAGYNMGLLEVKTNYINGGQPKGFMIFEDVLEFMERLNGGQNRRGM